MSEETKQTPGSTQMERRAKYGLNTTVGIVVAVGIVVLLNIIAFRNRDEYGRRIRFDWTSSGQYSLSEQTLRVLDGVDSDIELISLFRSPDKQVDESWRAKQIQDARDLVDEFGRSSSRVTVDQIDPIKQPERYEDFKQRIVSRFSERLDATRKAIADGSKALRTVSADVSQFIDPLEKLSKDSQITDRVVKATLNAAVVSLTNLGSNVDQALKQIDNQMTDTLPDFTGANQLLLQMVQDIDRGVLAPLAHQLETMGNQSSLPNATREALLKQAGAVSTSRDQIKAVITQLEQVESLVDYDAARVDVLSANPVVLLSDQEVRVVSLDEMFPDMADAESDEQSLSYSFLGEEMLTGALLAMSMDTPPLVVFVSGGRTPPLGGSRDPSSSFIQVGSRLNKMNFEVQQWVPAPSGNPMQPTPPQPPPTPKERQKVVWVLLPPEAINPRNPMAGGDRNRVAQHIQARMEAGDAALIMTAVSDNTLAGAVDPLEEIIKPFGITSQTDRLLIQEIATREDEFTPSAGFYLTQWPKDMAISSGLQGMAGLFTAACPLLISAPETGDKPVPIVTLTGDRMWAERDLAPGEVPKYDKDSAKDQFVVAVAAQGAKTRLVVVSDALWASDQVTGQQRYQRRGNSIGIGSVFPANGELFANCVYWLAEMEDLIAASARTQDIPRINPITPGSLATLKWSLMSFMVLASMIGGIVVWRVRQHG